MTSRPCDNLSGGLSLGDEAQGEGAEPEGEGDAEGGAGLAPREEGLHGVSPREGEGGKHGDEEGEREEAGAHRVGAEGIEGVAVGHGGEARGEAAAGAGNVRDGLEAAGGQAELLVGAEAAWVGVESAGEGEHGPGDGGGGGPGEAGRPCALCVVGGHLGAHAGSIARYGRGVVIAVRRHRALWTLAVLSVAMAYGAEGAAQRRRDAGVAVDAGPAPAARVEAALGGVAVVASRGGRTRSSGELTIPVTLRRGGCYRVLGAADGEAQTYAEVTVRTATVLAPLALAHAEGRVADGRFCVEEVPELYRLAVRAEGPAAWHVAVVEAPPAPAPPRAVTVSAVDAGAPAGPGVSTTEYDIGAGANDYVGAQLRAYAAARPGRVGFTPVVREVLPTHAQHTRTVVLPAGRCIESVAAGVPSVADLELLIEDPNGNRVAQDGTRRSTEGVRFCPVFSGTYTLRVRVRMGAGLVAMQCLIER